VLLAKMLEVECANALALVGQLSAVTAGPLVLGVPEAKVLTLLEIDLLSAGTERGPFEASETLANVTLEEVHPSGLPSAETEPPEDHEDYAVDSRVLLVAGPVVDLVDSFLLVVVEICRASNHPLLVTVKAVMESAPCSQILAPCFQVVSCQEEGLDAQEHQARGCT